MSQAEAERPWEYRAPYGYLLRLLFSFCRFLAMGPSASIRRFFPMQGKGPLV